MTATLIILALAAAFLIGGWSGYRAGKGDLADETALAADAETQVDDLIAERDTAQRANAALKQRLDASEQRASSHLIALNTTRADLEYAKAENRHLLDALAILLQTWDDKATTGYQMAAGELRRLIYPPDVVAAIDTALAAEERIAAQIEGQTGTAARFAAPVEGPSEA